MERKVLTRRSSLADTPPIRSEGSEPYSLVRLSVLLGSLHLRLVTSSPTDLCRELLRPVSRLRHRYHRMHYPDCRCQHGDVDDRLIYCRPIHRSPLDDRSPLPSALFFSFSHGERRKLIFLFLPSSQAEIFPPHTRGPSFGVDSAYDRVRVSAWEEGKKGGAADLSFLPAASSSPTGSATGANFSNAPGSSGSHLGCEFHSLEIEKTRVERTRLLTRLRAVCLFASSSRIAPAVVLGFGMFLSPYSPRWLAQQGRHEEAFQALLRLHGNQADRDIVQYEIDEIIT